MKNKNLNKLCIVAFVLVALVFALSSCTSADVYASPISEWSAESDIFQKILVWPIAWLMNKIATFFPEGYGQFAIGLLFTTLLVRTVAWPIYAKTNSFSLKTAVAQPELDKLNEKYAGRNDQASQQMKAQEMQAIYKKYGINPLGCLTVFLQMPIFMAMYTVVKRITVAGGTLTLSDASFFGIANCLNVGVISGTGSSSPVAELWSAPFFIGIILSLIVGGTMWLSNYLGQKQPSYVKKKPSLNQQANQTANAMKVFSYVMIGMMVFIALQNNGLALYWVIGNIYSLVQTIISRKLNEKKFYKMRNEIDVLIK